MYGETFQRTSYTPRVNLVSMSFSCAFLALGDKNTKPYTEVAIFFSMIPALRGNLPLILYMYICIFHVGDSGINYYGFLKTSNYHGFAHSELLARRHNSLFAGWNCQLTLTEGLQEDQGVCFPRGSCLGFGRPPTLRNPENGHQTKNLLLSSRR